MNTIIREYSLESGRTIKILSGDITRENVDAIVNAANAYLQHGGGVAGAITRLGGPLIQEESDRWVKKYGPVQHKYPAYTTGGELPCRYIIHAVGPVWGEGNEDEKLADAIHGSLVLADKLKLNSISFPAISTGVFRFPAQQAISIILEGFIKYFEFFPNSMVSQIRLVMFDKDSLPISIQVADKVFENESIQ
jgi:O-acetyl-ADP-ribose deacetylase (regulator of RNase III)